MEKMIENGQNSVATSAMIEKIASIINDRRDRITMINDDTLRDNGINNVPSFRAVIAKLAESGRYAVRVYPYAFKEGYTAEFKWERWSKNAVKDFAKYILSVISTFMTPELGTTDAPAEVEAEKVDNEVITEAVPAEAEDNNVYFTYNDIYEALNTILNAKSSKVQVELHEISEITDVPKSMCFFKEALNCIGVNFINYCDADDPLAVSFRFPEEYLRKNINDITLELADSPFNDDPNPQTEDYEEAAPAESNNDLVEKVVEIVKKVKDGREINVSKEVCQKNGIDVSSWPVFVANLTKNSDNRYEVKVRIYNKDFEILAKFNHDTGSKRWSEAVEYDVAAYIVDTLTEYVSQTEEYKKAEAEAVKALPF